MPSLADSPSLRFLALTGDQLDGVREVYKAVKLALRSAREAFAADEACFALARPGMTWVEPSILVPARTRWDAVELTDFLFERRPKMPPHLLAAPLKRRGRAWGVLAVRRASPDFAPAEVREIARVAELVSRAIERIDAARIVEVRERIDRKVLEQLRPNDLFYQILHGLRSLTGYDHSAAILMESEPGGALSLVAEQMTWRKGKSQRVGIERALDAIALEVLHEGAVTGFDLVDGGWREWTGCAAASLADALDYNRDGSERREASMLCAPLVTRQGPVGLIKVASCHPGTLAPYEGELVRRFLPQAATALHHMQRTRTLESGMLAAERKHALANLARGVSHDVNNALGSMLPLVQQLLGDARRGRVDERALVEDLEHVEESLRVCRRIFSGMLSLARGHGSGLGEGNVRRALDGMLAVLGDSMRREGIRVQLELPDSLPTVRGAQADLEQLFLNLASNARDAMPAGGSLQLAVRSDEESVLVEVTDTGCGIAIEHLERVSEPFFTTKPGGNGLGLSICQSILGSMGGRMTIESQVDEGTRVLLLLPIAARAGGDELEAV